MSTSSNIKPITRCTLNDDPWFASRTKQGGESKKEKKRNWKKVNERQKNRLNRNSYNTNNEHSTHAHTFSSEVLSFFKILSYCVQTFPIPPYNNSIYIRVLQTERSKWRLMRLFLYESERKWQNEIYTRTKVVLLLSQIPYGALLLYIRLVGMGGVHSLHGISVYSIKATVR